MTYPRGGEHELATFRLEWDESEPHTQVKARLLETPMNEQPLDLRRILRAVWKRWMLVLVLLWAGCVGGFLLAGRRTPVYMARSSVLLPPSPVEADGTQSRNIETQVNIAANGNILEQAGKAVAPPLGARTMRKRIKVKALTADILEVRAEASSRRDAALLADAVATEYVAAATDASSRIAGTAVSSLQAKAVSVEARLQQVKAELDATTAELGALRPNSPERARRAAIVDSVRLDEVEASRQLADLADRIAEARLEDQLNREATRLLAPAISSTRPVGVNPLVLTAVGGLLGVMAAVLSSLVADRRDQRLRRRSEIAEVVAAPVLASLETPRRSSTRNCQAMLDHWEPRPLQSWALRQAFLRLGVLQGDPPSNVVVVGLPGDVAGPLLTLQLAVFAASMGTRTALVVATPHPTAARMRSACHRILQGSEVRPMLTVHSEKIGKADHDDRPRPELTVTLVIAEPDHAEVASIPHRAFTTLAVSAGFATADTLAATALACLDAGHPILGVFLANPDPLDATSGDLVGLPSLLVREEGRVSFELGEAVEADRAVPPGRELEADHDEEEPKAALEPEDDLDEGGSEAAVGGPDHIGNGVDEAVDRLSRSQRT